MNSAQATITAVRRVSVETRVERMAGWRGIATVSLLRRRVERAAIAGEDAWIDAAYQGRQNGRISSFVIIAVGVQ
jgi:hypothetical protein